MMYWSSEAGKAGDSGTAMDLAARIASRVTFGVQRQWKSGLNSYPGNRGKIQRNGAECDWLTHIVVAVLNQKCNPFTVNVIPPSFLIQLVPDLGHIAKELSILEAASASGVNDSSRVRIVPGNCLKHGQFWE